MTVFNAISGGGSQASVPMDERVKAWIIFDGYAATPTPAGSYNIASITDNGAGKFAVNFTKDMASVNYCPACWAGSNKALNASTIRVVTKRGTTDDPTVSTFSFTVNNDNGTYLDADYIAIAFFGG